MKKIMIMILLLALSTSTAVTAEYKYISKGDYYYINEFGGYNPYVKVINKLSNNKVKVRDLSDGSTYVVYASQLLTKSELEADQIRNTIGGVAIGVGIVYCLFHPNECK